MNELMDQLDAMQRPRVLSHIDSVADNFLFLPDGSVRLIDWEYAGMCDPLIDLSTVSYTHLAAVTSFSNNSVKIFSTLLKVTFPICELP